VELHRLQRIWGEYSLGYYEERNAECEDSCYVSNAIKNMSKMKILFYLPTHGFNATNTSQDRKWCRQNYKRPSLKFAKLSLYKMRIMKYKLVKVAHVEDQQNIWRLCELNGKVHLNNGVIMNHPGWKLSVPNNFSWFSNVELFKCPLIVLRSQMDRHDIDVTHRYFCFLFSLGRTSKIQFILHNTHSYQWLCYKEHSFTSMLQREIIAVRLRI
jgi:hypothetical protein